MELGERVGQSGLNQVTAGEYLGEEVEAHLK